MKITRPLIMASIFLSMTSFAQMGAPMGGAPDNILFLGFNNVFTVNDETGKDRIFNVTFNGGEVKALQANDGSTSHGRYIIFPDGSNKNPELIITDNEGVEMNRKSFRASRIPDTDVQFATPDGKFSMSERKLVPHNEAFSYFEKIFEVQGWQLEI